MLDQPSTPELHPYPAKFTHRGQAAKMEKGLTVHAIGNTLPGEKVQSPCDIGNFSARLYMQGYIV